jgi:hypothetical protein
MKMKRPIARSNCRKWNAALLLMICAAAGAVGAQTLPSPSVVTSACHVSPIVSDLDKLAHFYSDVIGLDLVPAPGPGRLLWDTDPGHLESSRAAASTPSLYWCTDAGRVLRR